MLPIAFEPLGAAFSVFAFLTVPVFGLVTTWMLLMAYSLLKGKEETIKISSTVWIIAFIFWFVNVIPAFL
jgi:hypothetical protein